MKTQREYNGVCKVPSQVLPSAADLKRLQKKRKKMEDQLKAKGDSEEVSISHAKPLHVRKKPSNYAGKRAKKPAKPRGCEGKRS
ncbi:hypothetical protein B9Z55_010008 [Caenorhabditis nigoni]|uniref:Uncharacterized protein n=1 Tax=Caenorhabditis nigoni TaxID=1611254 RepID=A0A2G5UEN0_9PELO|nr:hypothetical protein B9Z55_010008 [Caenorhabditis nigoni]